MAEKYGKKVKELMTREMKEVFSQNKGFVFSSLENIKAPKMDAFRKKMRRAGFQYLVIKNRLAKIALEDAGMEEISGVVEEQKTIGIGVIKEDPVQLAKIMMEFAKEAKGFKVSSGYLEGRVLKPERIKELSELPGREQLISMVMSMMNAPITGFVGVLSAALRNLLYAVNAIKEKKEGK